MWQSTSKGLFSVVDRAYLYSEEAGTKVLASQLFFDCRARRSG